MTHAGEPVSKEAMLAEVWKDTVVSDDSLISCIQEVRKALGDDPKNPRYIETRHRRGYPVRSRAVGGCLRRTSAAGRTSRSCRLKTPAVIPKRSCLRGRGSRRESAFTALSKHRTLLVHCARAELRIQRPS